MLVRSRCTADQTGDGNCRGYVERTVWDGDQALYEIRAPGHDSATSEQMENDSYTGTSPYGYDLMLGRVGYVHAGGIDAPLAVYRMGMAGQPAAVGVAPHANFQGDFEIGSMIGGSYGGQSSRSCQGYYGCPVINWPGGNTTVDGEVPNPNPVQTWFGNLLSQKSDGSGLQYMRNRYYDPRTGRFTQSDPIGLAGGLNLYGFASGDPVNFSDPFGLCTKADGWKDCDRMISAAQGVQVARHAAESGEWTYSQYPSGVQGDPTGPLAGERLGDCTDFARYAVSGALGSAWAGGQKANTTAFNNGTADGFTEVMRGAAQPGDVVVRGGHAGIFTGLNSRGQVRGLANNGQPNTSPGGYKDNATRVINLGPSKETRFFRPLLASQP